MQSFHQLILPVGYVVLIYSMMKSFLFFLLVIRVLLIKLKNRRKQIQGVHDGEHKEMLQTNNLHAYSMSLEILFFLWQVKYGTRNN